MQRNFKKKKISEQLKTKPQKWNDVTKSVDKYSCFEGRRKKSICLSQDSHYFLKQKKINLVTKVQKGPVERLMTIGSIIIEGTLFSEIA